MAPSPPLTIVFQNPHLVGADKPAGLLTVPSRIGASDPRPCLGRVLEEQLGQRLWPVHRLDVEVSGLVLFARSAEAHRTASVAFEARRVKKSYQAITEGAASLSELPASFTWQSRLFRGKRRTFEAPHGRMAVTHAVAQARVHIGGEDFLVFDLEPETGRSHQLRVHLAKAGFPILGDALYGARAGYDEPGAIALRSVRLAFTDDRERQTLGIPGPLEVSPLPILATTRHIP